MRAAVDRVNGALRDVLQERARLVVEIARWKRARGLAIADPGREARMVAELLSAPGDGFDAAALERLFRAVLAESRALAERTAAAPERQS